MENTPEIEAGRVEDLLVDSDKYLYEFLAHSPSDEVHEWLCCTKSGYPYPPTLLARLRAYKRFIEHSIEYGEGNDLRVGPESVVVRTAVNQQGQALVVIAVGNQTVILDRDGLQDVSDRILNALHEDR